jgi:hypothetical protein
MGLLTFSINVTLDGCVDHQEGIADDETHAFFTRLMDEGGAMLWGRATYEMMESYWPAVARGDEEAPPAMREWAVKLDAKPKYVVSSTRKDFPWHNSHHVAGDRHAYLPADHREHVDGDGDEQRNAADDDEHVSRACRRPHVHIHSDSERRRQCCAGNPAAAAIFSRYAITAPARSSQTHTGRPGGSTKSGTTPVESPPPACAITTPSAPCTASG